ncbi:unnamed protein product [Macrosiphum euphorbiae]|nr:unnamed protein product [Macrosiphum euphorbiae]
MDIFGIFYEDDDQEIIEFLNYQRRTYTIRMRVDHMTLWDDHDFRIRFRISKVVVLQVLDHINDQISSLTDR